MPPLKVIMSGGGTGGHIFPAISIANEIKKTHPDANILFVGAKGKMEMEKVPAAGYPIEGLWISGLQRKLTLSNLSFPFKVIASLWKARQIVRAFKPDVVIGTGGFASGPMLKAAAAAGIPTLIQEQNSYPGITNKILSSKVSKICVAYEGLERFFPKEKILFTGNPIRQDILNPSISKAEALRFFELEEQKKTVLVIGGSLGARTINRTLLRIMEELSRMNIQVLWQCGKSFKEEQASLALPRGVKLHAFIQRMDMAFAAADVVVSRAGASSVSELCVLGKACIFVPSPNVAEDHQTKNAMALVEKGACKMVKDAVCQTELLPVLKTLLGDEGLCHQLEERMRALGKKDAAKDIAAEVFKLIARN